MSEALEKTTEEKTVKQKRKQKKRKETAVLRLVIGSKKVVGCIYTSSGFTWLDNVMVCYGATVCYAIYYLFVNESKVLRIALSHENEIKNCISARYELKGKVCVCSGSDVFTVLFQFW